jgi:RimJ/RimL family protein N-acetyltransferase
MKASWVPAIAGMTDLKMNEFDIAFEPVAEKDYPLLRRWLNAPHIREWWGDPETELVHIVDMVEGRDTTRPYIFHVDGAPTGYIQVWRIGPHQTEAWSKDNPWLMELPPRAVGVDLSIGEADMLAKGIGSAVLRRFVAMLKAEGHTAIIIDPDPKNSRAVRAYAKAGFTPVPHLAGRTDGVLIMQHDLTSNEMSP